MKVLVDMNLSPRWTEVLQQAGFQAVHWSAVGAATASDQQIMSFARAEGYVVLTHDLDFGDILAATNGDKPSVVQIRADNVSPSVIGPAVVSGVRQMKRELDDGALLTIEPNRLRL